jgi:hypothetical protein
LRHSSDSIIGLDTDFPKQRRQVTMQATNPTSRRLDEAEMAKLRRVASEGLDLGQEPQFFSGSEVSKEDIKR